MIKAKQTKKQASLDSITTLEDEVKELNRRKKVQCLAAKFQDVINYRNTLKQEGLGYKPLMLVDGSSEEVAGCSFNTYIFWFGEEKNGIERHDRIGDKFYLSNLLKRDKRFPS